MHMGWCQCHLRFSPRSMPFGPQRNSLWSQFCPIPGGLSWHELSCAHCTSQSPTGRATFPSSRSSKQGTCTCTCQTTQAGSLGLAKWFELSPGEIHRFAYGALVVAYAAISVRAAWSYLSPGSSHSIACGLQKRTWSTARLYQLVPLRFHRCEPSHPVRQWQCADRGNCRVRDGPY